MDARSAAILTGRVTAYGLATAAIAILANTAVRGCQDQGTGPAAAGAPAGPATTAPAAPGGPGGATPGLPPAAAPTSPASASPASPSVPPQVAAAALRALAGRWLSSTAKDYFVFRSDGAGAWMVRGRALWQGEVIPTGPDAFRLAWQSTKPQNAASWHVTLLAGGRTLVFDGTGKEYRKV
ncbi:MAG TPA: hypothetical protein VFU43_29185 [Streptosporangiaceae bacterium]|nr:hypothetical protein [Streptosporangiaceae bacterium]